MLECGEIASSDYIMPSQLLEYGCLIVVFEIICPILVGDMCHNA